MPTNNKRFTFYLDNDVVNEFQNAAYWDRKAQSEVLNKLLSQHLAAWKTDKANKAHISGGKIKQRPEGE